MSALARCRGTTKSINVGDNIRVVEVPGDNNYL